LDKSLILKRISEPHDEETIYELYCHVLEILKLYLTDDRSNEFVQMLVDTFIIDRTIIFLDHSSIKRKTLTYKVLEAEDRNAKLNEMTTENRFLKNFFTQQNIDSEARIGREQGYSEEGFNIARRLRDVYSDKGEEDAPDLGSDGTKHDEDYEE
jgi:hypothetical protein